MYECAALAKAGNAPTAIIFYQCKRKDQQFSAQVKVENSRLYYAGWAEALLALIRALNWTVQRVNRIDVCCDFNTFANGRSPMKFCQDYLSKPTKGRPSFIRHSSNKVRAVATRRLTQVAYETLSWGTRDSAVQVNLYNKSLELTEKTDKPWIRQRWVENGLLHDPAGKMSGKPSHVWRLEFSLNPSAVCLRAKKANDVSEFNINHVCTPAALIETFNVLLPAYFSFHFLTKEDSNAAGKRVRDLPLVELFKYDDAVLYRPMGVRYFHKSTRTDRLLLKRLHAVIDDDALSSDEKQAFAVVVNRLIEIYLSDLSRFDLSKMSDSIMQSYLRECFAELTSSEGTKRIAEQDQQQRRARRWVRMLRGAHDSDLAKYEEAMSRLLSYENDDAFKQCLEYCQKVSWAPLSDCSDALSDYIDCDVELETVIPTANP